MNKITVAEYAKLHSISVQAVYKKINRLNTVEEVINGRKQIFIIMNNATDIQPNSTDELNSTPANSTPTIEVNSTDELNSTPANSTLHIQPNSTDELNLEALKEQLQEKDKQIERLLSIIEDKDKQIQEQFNSLTNLLLRAQELEAISQRLLTAQKQEPKKISLFERIFKRKREE